MNQTKKITIFEGPDCSGKTTAAMQYAKETGARYVHFNNLPLVTDHNIARFYIDGMLPALLGYQDVVMDRCWLSEVPYGRVFRSGLDRVEVSCRRILERIAMRCGAIVVLCLPPQELVVKKFEERISEEYLETIDNLVGVYKEYQIMATDLMMIRYDYTTETKVDPDRIDLIRPQCHRLDITTAGNYGARIILVGEKSGHHKLCDSFYQFPFSSISKDGCSRWLTDQLEQHKIYENELMWINADQDLSLLAERHDIEDCKIVALGNIADIALNEIGIDHIKVPHPQSHKRFHHFDEYTLFRYI